MKLNKYHAQAGACFAVSIIAGGSVIASTVKSYITYRRTIADINARRDAAVIRNRWASEQIISEIDRGRYNRRGIDALFADWKYYEQVAPDPE